MSQQVFSLTTPSKEAAIHVLHIFDSVGYPPGEFTRRLIEAMIHADSHNLARFALGFPDYASSVRMYKNVNFGREELYRIASLPMPEQEVTPA